MNTSAAVLQALFGTQTLMQLEETQPFMDNTLVLSLNPALDTQLAGTVYVGTPAQQIQVILDTGSANTWLADSLCTTCSQQVANQFNPDNSTTFKQLTSKVSSTIWTKGLYSGWDSEDMICVDKTQTRCTGNDMLFNTVLQQQGITYLQGNGVIGLAPNQMEGSSADTLFTNALNVSKFSVNVPENRITFGAKDQNPFYGSMAVEHFIEQGSSKWEVPMSAVSYNFKQLSGSYMKVRFDTGNSFNMVPKSFTAQLMYQIGTGHVYNDAEGHFQTFICTENEFEETNDLVLTLGSQTIIYPKLAWIQRDFGKCTIKFLTDPQQDDTWILGFEFFRDFYVEFNTGANKSVQVWPLAYGILPKNNSNVIHIQNATALLDNTQDQILNKKREGCDGTFDVATLQCSASNNLQSLASYNIILI